MKMMMNYEFLSYSFSFYGEIQEMKMNVPWTSVVDCSQSYFSFLAYW